MTFDASPSAIFFVIYILCVYIYIGGSVLLWVSFLLPDIKLHHHIFFLLLLLLLSPSSSPFQKQHLSALKTCTTHRLPLLV